MWIYVNSSSVTVAAIEGKLRPKSVETLAKGRAKEKTKALLNFDGAPETSIDIPCLLNTKALEAGDELCYLVKPTEKPQRDRVANVNAMMKKARAFN